MFREETGERLVVSSSYICCHTHSSSALPTRFSPLLLPPTGVQTQPPQGTGASVLLSARLCAGKRDGSRKTESVSPLCTPLETPARAFVGSGFILAYYARRACSWVIWGELSGQPACVLQVGTVHEPRAKELFWGYSQRAGERLQGEKHTGIEKQRRRMGNSYSPQGLEEEYPVSA